MECSFLVRKYDIICSKMYLSSLVSHCMVWEQLHERRLMPFAVPNFSIPQQFRVVGLYTYTFAFINLFFARYDINMVPSQKCIFGSSISFFVLSTLHLRFPILLCRDFYLLSFSTLNLLKWIFFPFSGFLVPGSDVHSNPTAVSRDEEKVSELPAVNKSFLEEGWGSAIYYCSPIVGGNIYLYRWRRWDNLCTGRFTG